MADETTFFQWENITVTNARFIVRSQTFAMGGVTSINGVETPAAYLGPGLLILFGCALGFGTYAVRVIGLLLVVAGIVIAIKRKPKFSVVLRTSSGEVTAYESQDKKLISEIINALNESIVFRG